MTSAAGAHSDDSEPVVRRSLDQQRAAQAARDVRAARDTAKSGEYRRLVESLPAMVLANGLGQACAYLLARAEGKQGTPEALLYEQLQSWLRGRVHGLDGSLVDALANADVATYQRGQVEALAYVQWLKRFAQAELPRASRRA